MVDFLTQGHITCDVYVNYMGEFWFLFILILNNWFVLRIKKMLVKDFLLYCVHILAACHVIGVHVNWNEFCFVRFCLGYVHKSLKVILLL